MMASTSPSGSPIFDPTRRRSVTFAPPESFISVHNIPLSPDRERHLFERSRIMQEIRATVLPLNVKAVQIVLLAASHADEQEHVEACELDGAALLKMRLSNKTEGDAEITARSIWSRSVERIFSEYISGSYEYGCALLNALQCVALDIRSWRTGVLDDGELSDESARCLDELANLAREGKRPSI